MRRLSLLTCMMAGLLGAPAFVVSATAPVAAAPDAPRKDAKEAPRAPDPVRIGVDESFMSVAGMNQILFRIGFA